MTPQAQAIAQAAATLLADIEAGASFAQSESALIDLLIPGWIAKDAPAHVETDCVEHGVVHISTQGDWIEVDPATGEVTAL